MPMFIPFLEDESGATTVDWVVLCAAGILVTLSVIASASEPLVNGASAINGGIGQSILVATPSEG